MCLGTKLGGTYIFLIILVVGLLILAIVIVACVVVRHKDKDLDRKYTIYVQFLLYLPHNYSREIVITLVCLP